MHTIKKLLLTYYLNISVYKRQIYQIAESNRKNRFGSKNQIELFCPNWNALPDAAAVASRRLS